MPYLAPRARIVSILALVVTVFAARPGPVRSAPAGFVCPPCGQDCDRRVFEHAGNCPLCGMRLQPQSPAASGPLPRTGLDVSGARQFCALADLLLQDREPSDSAWRALLDSPGYRLVHERLDADLREDIDLALKPSRHAAFEREARGDGDRALMLRHLALAGTRRRELEAFADSLERSTAVAQGVSAAARLLPAGATGSGDPPFVTAAIFKDDGYSLPDGIVVDLLYMRSLSFARFLGHEFHHSYVARLSRPLPAGSDSAADDPLRRAFTSLRDEGIADQIDKPHPFVPPSPGLATYAERYNREYARTPEVLRTLDSLLTAVVDHPGLCRATGMDVQMLFWSNGHPHGAYMAREIGETFGDDSLRVAALDPARFLRLFAAAEQRHGRADPLSSKSWQVIQQLDERYWAR